MKIEFEEIGQEPVSLPDMKNYLRVDGDLDDDMIQAMMEAARKAIESYCGISIIEKDISLVWESYRPVERVPYSPVKEYISVTVDGEDVDEPKDDMLRYPAGELAMEYTAGFSDVPHSLVMAIKLLTRMYYDNTWDGNTIPASVRMLIEPHNTNLFL